MKNKILKQWYEYTFVKILGANSFIYSIVFLEILVFHLIHPVLTPTKAVIVLVLFLLCAMCNVTGFIKYIVRCKNDKIL